MDASPVSPNLLGTVVAHMESSDTEWLQHIGCPGFPWIYKVASEKTMAYISFAFHNTESEIERSEGSKKWQLQNWVSSTTSGRYVLSKEG